jgi:predicted extracellular nuclease
VHYNSPDERGIGVAFLYQKEHFELIYSDTFTLFINDHENNRDYTRDVLLISGNLFKEQVYVIINHWPSRNSGTKASDYKRVQAAKLVRDIIKEIYQENPDPKIIIMGDFNDVPNSTSVKKHLVTQDFFNPMLELQEKNKGSVNYFGKWYLFDQIIFNSPFLEKKSNQISYKEIAIFDDHFLQETTGKRKGAPKRTFLGKWHQGGFSDHFPVYAYLEKLF